MSIQLTKAGKLAAQYAVLFGSNDEDWQKRFVGLQGLQAAINDGLDGDPSPIRFTTKEITVLRSGLQQQITDLRSTLAKEASLTVLRLAETHDAAFSSHAQIFLGTLLKQTASTVKVIAEASHTTVMGLLRLAGAVPVSKALPEIAKGLQDGRNASLRKNCALYLLLLVKERANDPELRGQLDSISTWTVSLARDNSASTRARARSIYGQLRLISPKHATKILEQADRKLKALLEEQPEGSEADLDVTSVRDSPPPTSRSSRNPSRNPSRSNSRAQSRNTSPTRGGSSSTGAVPSYASATQSSQSKVVSASSSSVSSPNPTQASQRIAAGKSPALAGGPGRFAAPGSPADLAPVDINSVISKLHAHARDADDEDVSLSQDGQSLDAGDFSPLGSPSASTGRNSPVLHSDASDDSLYHRQDSKGSLSGVPEDAPVESPPVAKKATVASATLPAKIPVSRLQSKPRFDQPTSSSQQRLKTATGGAGSPLAKASAPSSALSSASKASLASPKPKSSPLVDGEVVQAELAKLRRLMSRTQRALDLLPPLAH